MHEIPIQCIIKDMDCIQSTYNQIKKDKNETTIFIHGYLGGRDTIPVPYIRSGTNNLINSSNT